MSPTGTILISIIIVSFFQAIKSQDTKRWDITIYNPTNPTHEIPIHILMPNISSSTSHKFGLLLFMHGDPCEWWWYEYLSQYIVPNGYIAGLLASYEPAGGFDKMSIDMRYSLDYLYNQSLTNTSSPIYNSLLYKSVAAGHSAGADAALLTVGRFENQNFKYTFNGIYAMASANTIEVQQAIKNMENNYIRQIPIFLIAGSSDCIAEPEKSITVYNEIMNGNGTCKYYGIIVNGTHCHFADIYEIDNVCYDVEEDSCPLNEKNRTIVARDVQLDLSKNYLLQFMNAALKDQDGSQSQQQHFDALYNNMIASEQAGYMMNVTYDCKVKV